MTGLAFSPRLPRCYWRRLSESKQTGQPDAFASDFRGFFVASWRAAGSTPCPSGGRPPLNPAELHREVLLEVGVPARDVPDGARRVRPRRGAHE